MTKHPNQRKPSRWRWPRRITLVLLAGVLLTIASSWILQWRGFQASATSTSWRLDASVLYSFPTWQYAGDGVFNVYGFNDFDARWFTPAPIDIHHVPDLSWYVIDDKDSSYIRRNEWDYSTPVLRPLEPPGHPVVSSIHVYGSHNQHTFNLFNEIKPERALDLEPLDPGWLSAERCLDVKPGWFAASSFLRGHDESLHALHRPVERWSAQRCGWPMHAMMTEQYAIGPRPPIERVEDMPLVSLRHGLKGGLILHHQPQHPMLHPLGHHSLPLMPLWPGFATNTAAYAGTIALLWLTIAGGTHLLGTKKRRRKRGLCEACGYDIQGLTTCPECGNARAPA